MKGSTIIIQGLNDILCGELSAINQYFLHSRMCKNWGYQKLAKYIYEESISEMKHATALADRILFLEGIPNFQKISKINIGSTVKEQLESDFALEKDAILKLKNTIEICYDNHDHGTRELLENILKDEEGHIEWIDTQLSIIKNIGYANYLSQQLS